MLDPEHASCSIQSTLRALAISASQHPALLFIDTQKLLGCLGLDGVRWRQLGETGSVALFERGEHQVRLVRVKQKEYPTGLAKTQIDPYQIEIKLTLCGLGWA